MGRVKAFNHAWRAGWTVARKVYAFLRTSHAPGVRLDKVDITHTIWLGNETAGE